MTEPRMIGIMIDPVKVKQLHLVTDGMQFNTPQDGIAIVEWVCKAGGHAVLSWDTYDKDAGTFVGLRLFVGPHEGSLTRAEQYDWVVRDPFLHFRAVDLAVFEYTHEVVKEDS